MASFMPICAGLVGLKSDNIKISSALIRPKWAYKQQTHIFPTYFACPKKAPVRRESEQLSGAWRGEGVGEGKPFHLETSLKVWEVWRV